MGRLWFLVFWACILGLAVAYVLNVEAVIVALGGMIPFGEPIEEASEITTQAVMFAGVLVSVLFVGAVVQITAMRLGDAELGWVWLAPVFVWAAASALLLLWAPWILAAGKDTAFGPSVGMPRLPYESLALLGVFTLFLAAFGRRDPFRRRSSDVIAAWVVVWIAGAYATLSVGLANAAHAAPISAIRRPIEAVSDTFSFPFTMWRIPGLAENFGWGLVALFALALTYVVVRGGWRAELI